MKIGENIRKAREEKNISQKELAERLGVTPPMISQYETGKRNPRAPALIKIAEAIGCDPKTLVGGDVYIDDACGTLFFFDFDGADMISGSDVQRAKEKNLLFDFQKLNELGQDEALKRVSELAELEKYRKKDHAGE